MSPARLSGAAARRGQIYGPPAPANGMKIWARWPCARAPEPARALASGQRQVGGSCELEAKLFDIFEPPTVFVGLEHTSPAPGRPPALVLAIRARTLSSAANQCRYVCLSAPDKQSLGAPTWPLARAQMLLLGSRATSNIGAGGAHHLRPVRCVLKLIELVGAAQIWARKSLNLWPRRATRLGAKCAHGRKLCPRWRPNVRPICVVSFQTAARI